MSPSLVTCPRCHRSTSSDLARCEYCDAPWEPPAPPRPGAARDRTLPTWVGLVLAIVLLMLEFVDRPGADAAFRLVGVAAALYWLACVHSFHVVLRDLTGGAHPVSPGWSIGGHFIPFFNVYWQFRWPSALVGAVRDRGVTMLPGALLGLAIFTTFVVGRALDGALSFLVLVGIGAYIAARLRRAVVMRSVGAPEATTPA